MTNFIALSYVTTTDLMFLKQQVEESIADFIEMFIKKVGK